MLSIRRLLLVAVTLLLTACRATVIGPPQIVVDRTACSHCGMFVSEPAYAAAYQAPGNDPRVFDDIGCLVNAVRQETAAPLTIWLQDAAGSGWIAADDATFVAASRTRTPMNGGILAYAARAAAEKAAAANGGQVMRSWLEVMNRDGEAK